MFSSNYHLILAALAILISACIFGSEKFAFIDKDIKTKRFKNIDGLRYLLASFVALHHLIIGKNFFNTGEWKLPDNIMDIFVGQFGVIIFFMVSGSLFVSLCDNGTDWLKFYIKRFFRLAPMLFISSVFCVVIAGAIQLHNGSFVYNDNFINWFDAAILNQRPDLFGLAHSFTISGGVTWTLFWEWSLYFSLPLIFIINSRKESFSLMIAILFICYYIYSKYDYMSSIFISSFAFGGLAKLISQKITIKNRSFIEILTIVSFAASFFVGCYSTPFTLTALLVYSIFFLMICLGGSFFGILNTSGFRRLGDASFSIYLMHPIVWFAMNKVMMHLGIFNNIFLTCIISTVSWVFTCFISVIAFHYIESYFIDLGKKITMRTGTNSN